MPIGSPVKQLSIVECFKKQHLNKLTNIPKAKIVIDLTSDEPDEAHDSRNNNRQVKPIPVQRNISSKSTDTNIASNRHSFFESSPLIECPLFSPVSQTLAKLSPEQETDSQIMKDISQSIEVKGFKRLKPNIIISSQNDIIDSDAEGDHSQINLSMSLHEENNAAFPHFPALNILSAEQESSSQISDQDDSIIEFKGFKRSRPNIIISSQDENNDFVSESENSPISNSLFSQEEDADFPPSSNEEFEEAESDNNEDQQGLPNDENWLKKVTDTLRPLSIPVDQQLGMGQEFMAYKKQWGYANKYKMVDPTESNCLLCEHKGISVFFKIKNIQTAQKLYTGSKCINQFRVIGEDNILLDDADSKAIIAIAIDDAYAELSEPRRTAEWFLYR